MKTKRIILTGIILCFIAGRTILFAETDVGATRRVAQKEGRGTASPPQEAQKNFEENPSIETATVLANEFIAEKKIEEGLKYFTSPPVPSPIGRGETGEREASANYARGLLFQAKNDVENTIKAFEDASREFLATGNKKASADSLHNVGVICYYSGKYIKALEFYEKSLQINEEAGNKEGMAAALNNIGGVHGNLGNYPTALDFFEKGLKINEETGNKQGIALSLTNMGNVHNYLSDYSKALEFFEKSAEINKETNNKTGMAMTLASIGTSHLNLDNYAKALEFYEKSLAICRETKNKFGEALLLNNIGAIYRNLGNYIKALEFYEKSLRIKKDMGNTQGVAYSLHNLGAVHRNLGDYVKALEFYEKSLRINEEIKNKPGASITLANIATIYRSSGEYEKAFEYYEKSLKISEETGDKSDAAITLNGLGWNYVKYGNAEKGILLAERSLALGEEIGALKIIYESHHILGSAYKDMGKPDIAIKHLRSAVDTAESIRSLLTESEHKMGFLSTKLDAYEKLVEVLIIPLNPPLLKGETGGLPDVGAGLPRPTIEGEETSPLRAKEESFSVLEKMKARAFLDELGRAKYLREGISEELLQKKLLLEARIKWLQGKTQ